MRRVVRGIGFLVTAVLIWYLIQMIAAESGEVVVLTTVNAEGEQQETRLWVVDYEEGQWLRSGSSIQSWYANILERPQVGFVRGEQAQIYTAVPSVEDREEINRLMLEKYGWAEDYIGFFFSRDKSIPIRLVAR